VSADIDRNASLASFEASTTGVRHTTLNTPHYGKAALDPNPELATCLAVRRIAALLWH
jgi:hypothetical protein